MAEKLRIGVVARRWRQDPSGSYARNVLNRLPDAEYVPVGDLFSSLVALNMRANALFHRLTGRSWLSHFNLNNQFYRLRAPAVDVLHLFNGVSYNTVPWVTSFETAVPRFTEVMEGLKRQKPQFSPLQKWRFELAARAMASESCLAIIPISENAARAQRLVLGWMPPKYATAIAAKITVLHPPQAPIIKSFAEKEALPLRPLHFMFVGHDFFRKGGLEMLKAFIQVRKHSQIPIRLTIVSALRTRDYATRAGEKELAEARRLISANSEWITHYPSLPHAEVLALMKQAHVGLLPTYADSYGYAVLEFQAAGCPVITTEMGALAEVNSEERGWLIKVPRDHIGRAPYYTPEGRAAISKAIRNGVAAAIDEILQNPEMVRQKGKAALDYIRQNHDPMRHANTLREIYAQRVNVR